MLAFISKNKISLPLALFNGLVACWLAGFTNLSFYRNISQLSSYQGMSNYLFVFVTFILLSSFYFFVLQLLNWRRTAKPLSIILVIMTGMTSYFVNQLGVEMSTAQIENVAQTDLHETLDLLSFPFLLWCLLTVVLPVVVLSFLQIQPQSFKKVILTKVASLVVALAVMGGGLFSFYSQYAPIFREHRQLKAQISPMNVLSSGTSYIRKQFKHANKPLVAYGQDAHVVISATQRQPKILVLVVGETARAQNFSLDGYSKNTNPELSKLDILNFNNVSSCGTQTSVSVPCMFSGMPRKDYDEGLASHREGLLDIVQRAGYQVTWIDNNSGCKGTCTRIKNYISPKDDPRYQKWCDHGECRDGILIDALTDYLKTLDMKNLKQNQLIVLHQMGSHGPAYYKRYPAEFKKFTPICETNNIQNCDHQALINTYDNTIVYTDHILASTIDLLKQQPVASSMLYLSDHGESTGESGLYLHGTPYMVAPKEQTHIPMLFWFSQNWSERHHIYQCLSHYKDSAWSQDNLFPTVLGLLNVQTQVYDQKLDMLSSCKGQI
ncbi:phosphoethanolamine--lipid A transferase [Acinetobacter sp. ME22]|uniref:phosphoethanolamine transferase n=1 Tax=Acinetobacter sp. ME22 TaxID=2904802 RepID=UPI001ED9FA02|nr:phosphoethanolamine--lipid A transferase [Acinetobacter sp. ME22]MCG2572617.1 phosphoethanolamine--lipid A transferase [Acinetobacter sp. ME22]